jgi:hypothetical protein
MVDFAAEVGRLECGVPDASRLWHGFLRNMSNAFDHSGGFSRRRTDLDQIAGRGGVAGCRADPAERRLYFINISSAGLFFEKYSLWVISRILLFRRHRI